MHLFLYLFLYEELVSAKFSSLNLNLRKTEVVFT